jgi:hypothetical protein
MEGARLLLRLLRLRLRLRLRLWRLRLWRLWRRRLRRLRRLRLLLLRLLLLRLLPCGWGGSSTPFTRVARVCWSAGLMEHVSASDEPAMPRSINTLCRPPMSLPSEAMSLPCLGGPRRGPADSAVTRMTRMARMCGWMRDGAAPRRVAGCRCVSA